MRLLVAVSTALVVVSVAGAAPEAHTFPKLLVHERGSSITIEIAHDDLDEAAARVTIYPPAGYDTALEQPAGTTIGTARGLVTAPDLGFSRIVVAGSVATRSRSSFTVSRTGQKVSLAQAAEECTGTDAHAAFWVLTLRGSGETLEVPLFVDVAPPALAGFAGATIQGCLPPPDVPTGTPGRAPLGFELARISITFPDVFRGGLTGERRWRLVETEYVRDGGTPNALDTSEAQAVVYAGSSIDLEEPVATVRNGVASVKLRGRSTLPGSAAARYRLFRGSRRAALRSSVALGARGQAIAGRLLVQQTRQARTIFVQARGTVETLGLGASFCRPTFRPAGIPCVYATRMGTVVRSSVRRVVIPPRP